MAEINIQGFGYAEMYEWKEIPEHKNRLGRFVTFDKEEKSKITYAHNNDYLIGVTTVCAQDTSDDPDEWKYSYLCNEYGDLYLQKEKLAVGAKQYDQYLEMNYIRTYPWEHFIKIPNKYLDKEKKYVKRSNRPEWVRVTLVGKAIVKDNGKCKPGDFCTVYSGKIKDLYGTAIPATEKTKNSKYYVIDRLSENTILVLLK
jgi:hypothetical protein